MELNAELRRVKWLVAGLAVYIALGIVYLTQRTEFTFVTYDLYADKLLDFFLLVVPLASIIWLAFSSMFRAPTGPWRYFRGRFTPQGLARYVVGILLLLLLIPFLGTYTQIKGSLSLDGFTAEMAVANAEAWLHGGIDPSEWLAQTFGGGLLLRLVEVNYNVGWQAYNLLFLTFMMLHPAAWGARRFYMAFYFSLWVLLGNLMAGWWIAAGPCFYAEVTGDSERFAALHAMLVSGKDHAHSAYRLQQYLWHWWSIGASALGTGVAAFPSVHVFVVTCNALFTYRFLHRGLGVIAMCYAFVILISSAYLGWHYIIDGYVSAAITLALFTYFVRLSRRYSGNYRSSFRPPA